MIEFLDRCQNGSAGLWMFLGISTGSNHSQVYRCTLAIASGLEGKARIKFCITTYVIHMVNIFAVLIVIIQFGSCPNSVTVRLVRGSNSVTV